MSAQFPGGTQIKMDLQEMRLECLKIAALYRSDKGYLPHEQEKLVEIARYLEEFILGAEDEALRRLTRWESPT